MPIRPLARRRQRPKLTNLYSKRDAGAIVGERRFLIKSPSCHLKTPMMINFCKTVSVPHPKLQRYIPSNGLLRTKKLFIKSSPRSSVIAADCLSLLPPSCFMTSERGWSLAVDFLFSPFLLWNHQKCNCQWIRNYGALYTQRLSSRN